MTLKNYECVDKCFLCLCCFLFVLKVTLVINYNMPMRYSQPRNIDQETYIHRIGRTGRFGLKGLAISLLQPHEVNLIKQIEDFYKYVELLLNKAFYHYYKTLF